MRQNEIVEIIQAFMDSLLPWTGQKREVEFERVFFHDQPVSGIGDKCATKLCFSDDRFCLHIRKGHGVTLYLYVAFRDPCSGKFYRCFHIIHEDRKSTRLNSS